MVNVGNVWRFTESLQTGSNTEQKQGPNGFLDELISRTVIPRVLLIEKEQKKLELIVSNKKIIAMRASGVARYQVLNSDNAQDRNVVADLIRTFGPIGADAVFSLSRVQDELSVHTPPIGVSLSEIDLVGAGSPADSKPHKLRVVVDNNADQPAVAQSENVAWSSDKAKGKMEAFFELLRKHSKFSALYDSDAKLISCNAAGNIIPAEKYAELAATYRDWYILTEDELGLAPRLVSHTSKDEKDAVIAAVSDAQIVIGEIELIKLGTLMVQWGKI